MEEWQGKNNKNFNKLLDSIVFLMYNEDVNK